jgi:hypothetical protein
MSDATITFRRHHRFHPFALRSHVMNTEIPKTNRTVDDTEEGSSKSTTDSGAPIGEGSYEGTQRYAAGIENYLAHADVKKDAADAAPDSVQEADALKLAEEEAASRTRAPGK